LSKTGERVSNKY